MYIKMQRYLHSSFVFLFLLNITALLKFLHCRAFLSFSFPSSSLNLLLVILSFEVPQLRRILNILKKYQKEEKEILEEKNNRMRTIPEKNRFVSSIFFLFSSNICFNSSLYQKNGKHREKIRSKEKSVNLLR